MADDWQVELLGDQHERGEFSCGKAPLDLFLRNQAGQYSRKGVGRTYVAVRPGETRVLGYYTLAASSVPFAHVPPKLSKKLPRHPIPTILLGRLAVDQSVEGQGLGGVLLDDAFYRALGIADQLGVVAVHVHAIDDDAVSFYARFAFLSLLDDARHMMLLMETIRKGYSR